MKKLIILCLATTVLGYLLSCKKESQKLIDEISGNYNIDEIKYLLDNGTDSILNIGSGVIDFEHCKPNAQKNKGLCSGFYQINDEGTRDFKYSVSLGGDNDFITLDVLDRQNILTNLSGQLIITTQTDNILVLETGTNDGTLQIRLSR